MSGQAGNTNNPTITARFQTSPVIPWFSANAVVRPSECVARPLRSKLIGFRSCAMELPGKIQILIKPNYAAVAAREPGWTQCAPVEATRGEQGDTMFVNV